MFDCYSAVKGDLFRRNGHNGTLAYKSSFESNLHFLSSLSLVPFEDGLFAFALSDAIGNKPVPFSPLYAPACQALFTHIALFGYLSNKAIVTAIHHQTYISLELHPQNPIIIHIIETLHIGRE